MFDGPEALFLGGLSHKQLPEGSLPHGVCFLLSDLSAPVISLEPTRNHHSDRSSDTSNPIPSGCCGTFTLPSQFPAASALAFVLTSRLSSFDYTKTMLWIRPCTSLLPTLIAVQMIKSVRHIARHVFALKYCIRQKVNFNYDALPTRYCCASSYCTLKFGQDHNRNRKSQPR